MNGLICAWHCGKLQGNIKLVSKWFMPNLLMVGNTRAYWLFIYPEMKFPITVHYSQNKLCQIDQIAETIPINSFDEIAVVLPTVIPAGGLKPREDSMYIYYSLFSVIDGTHQRVVMRHITEYQSEKLNYWFRLLLNHINSINTLLPTDAIWRHRFGSTLAR